MLSETADLMEISSEDPFRIRSYRNAAAVIASYPERVADIGPVEINKQTTRHVPLPPVLGGRLRMVFSAVPFFDFERGSADLPWGFSFQGSR